MDRRRRVARTVALMSLFTMADTQTDVPIASFVGDGSDLISLIAGIEPIQDLNGYGNPWPAGGGKNIARPFGSQQTHGGVVFNGNGDCSCGISGTSVDRYPQEWANEPYDFLLHDTPLTLSTTSSGNVPSGAKLYAVVYERDTPTGANLETYSSKNGPVTFTISHPYQLLVIVAEGDGINYTGTNTTIYYQIEKGSSASSWAPYSNICPISGWTGANIHVSPTTDAADGTTSSITFPTEAGTVYGGTLDVTTGKLTVDRANIASYNGETLTGRWISDRDVYSAGTTPTIGAQVVYELTTPIVYDLAPTQVTTLIGTNNIWADTGDIKYIEYNI